tara:strand:- start:560964 stop:562346 length:1383 start_codon:yes stop_codon:yes gene_type:complete
MYSSVRNFFKGHNRTVKAKKNIIASFFIKGLNIIIGFLMVRITFDYLDETKYGIWLTLTSIIGWTSFFELGLGGGLKNRLAVSLANDDMKKAKTYVSTTYALLTIIIAVVALSFFSANFFIDWTRILNTDASYANELSVLVLIVFNFFFLQFILDLISIILKADQRPALGDSFLVIAKLISLILIFILTTTVVSEETSEGSLIYLGWILSASPVIVLALASFYLFNNDYKEISPSIKFVKFKYAKDLMNLGIKFFMINFSMIIIFQSSSLVIAQFYGVAEVTPYYIAQRLFSVVMLIFTIVAAPFQVAFTEAWVKKDIGWVKGTVKNLFKIWMGLVLLSIGLYFISDPFFNFWIGEEKMKTIIISNRLKISMIVSVLLFSLGGVFNMFINGVAKVSVQMYSHLIGALIFIPITYFFIKYLNWGIESVVVGSIFANFYYPIIAPIQYYKILTNRAKGIWNK